MLDKNKKREIYIIKRAILILIVAAIIMIFCFLFMKRECAVIIIEDESFLSGFEVINNEVHIYCVVSLKNNSNDMKEVKLSGIFQKEVENGLLKENSLEACFIEDAANSVVIEGNSTAKYIEVEFIGEYAGNPSMSSRELPHIEVMEMVFVDGIFHELQDL